MSQPRPIALMLVTDRELSRSRYLEDVVLQAIAGGVDCIQLREKHLSTRAFLEQASRIQQLMQPTGVPLIINDRLDIAWAIGADGVHLGQEDMPVSVARERLGPKAIIGLSVETWEDVENAQGLPVDYLGVSPVFSTPTKTDTKGAWGLEGLGRIKSYSRHPLVAIGGLGRSNIADVVGAGADGIAVVSAICSADDPKGAANELLRCIRGARKPLKDPWEAGPSSR